MLTVIVAVSILLTAAGAAAAGASAGAGTGATAAPSAGMTAVGGVIMTSCPDIAGVGSAVGVDIVTVSGKETAAPVIRNHTVDGPYLYHHEKPCDDKGHDNTCDLILF